MTTLLRLLIAGLIGLLWGCDSRSLFARHGDSWTYDGRSLALDAGTTVILDAHHAKDASRVIHADTYRDSSDYWSTRRVRITPIDGADAPSFRLLKYGYARDARRVYASGVGFAVQDLDSFELFEHGFARDRASGYYMTLPVPGSRGAGFTEIDTHHAHDGQHVFYAWMSTVKNGVSHPAEPAFRTLPGALPASFEVLEDGYSRDAGQAYFAGQRISRRLAALRLLGQGYASDGEAVFFGVLETVTLVKGAQAASFMPDAQAGEGVDARDATARYYRGKRL
jgi:hypothetical protein